MSKRFAEYLQNPEDIIEPDQAKDTLPKIIHPLLPFLDSHIDDFQISATNKKGRQIIVLKEGFKIIDNQFWSAFKSLKETADLKYFTVAKSLENDWYLADKIKRRK